MTDQSYSDILAIIIKYAAKPSLFELGDPHLWDDQHISKGMLEAHLNPDNDLASRRHATIDKEVRYLVSSGTLKKGDRLLDLGCGPGLYSIRLSEQGLSVTGIDISSRSLEYARNTAAARGLEIEYRLLNFFDIEYREKFDAVLQTNGELNTFSDDKRNELLSRLHRALKPGGLFVFDLTTRKQIKDRVSSISWHVSDGGFWRPGRHLVLEQGYDFSEESIWVNQYIIMDENGISVYRNWFHDYDLYTIIAVLEKAGFQVTRAWNDLTGTPYAAGGKWIALVARKV
jgi:SAM-dependent methyltransferase